MKIYVGITDKDWFEHLIRIEPDEVNFWKPSGARAFRVLKPGEPFLFKLHSPNNYVVGGGFFVRYSPLPASLSWDAFERKNGVDSFAELVTRVRKYRKDDLSLDPIIGCNVLAEPFFLPRDLWIPIPENWGSGIQQGKSYDTGTEEGEKLWRDVTQAMQQRFRMLDSKHVEVNWDERRFGAEYLTRGRLGQGAFRVLVTDAYERRCAVTGEKTLPVLEAAHIRPYSKEGPHLVSNGILLRSDLHKLFDLGYVTVTPKFRLEVSTQLKEDWTNGREYYAHNGSELKFLPGEIESRPGREFLEWHNTYRFKA